MAADNRGRKNQMHLWLSDEEDEALEHLADSWGVSRSDTLRIMLRNATEGSWTEVSRAEKGKRAKR